MCSGRLVFSTSKKIARRRAGNGRSGSGGSTRVAKRVSGLDRTISAASIEGSTGSGAGRRRATLDAFAGEGCRRARDGLVERVGEVRACFGEPVRTLGGRF